jgi:DDE superfamily endonuclease
MALASLKGLVNAGKRKAKEIEERELPSREDEDEPGRIEGVIAARFEDDESFVELTGFDGPLITYWAELMQPFAQNARKRGPAPKSSLADALLCYLVMLNVDADMPALAKTLGLEEAQFSGNIERVRGLLNSALKTKWPQLAPRPLEDDERPMPEVGLLVDTTTVECYKPKARFGESKHYFDGHHYVYGLKTEIAITSARPHVFVAKSGHYPGSVSDYRIHKENYDKYYEYLHKTPDERHWDQDDIREPNWAILADKMYIGPAADTPNIRRITPLKGHNLTTEQKASNKVKSKTRVYVECFFGRMYRKFPMLSGVYKFDHQNFDLDFENACLLINEDITISELALGDGEFYQKFLDERLERYQALEKKRKADYQKQKKNKKARLEKVAKYIG